MDFVSWPQTLVISSAAMDETRAVSAWFLALYTCVALLVTNAFPFSTFPMYSEAAPKAGARLVVRDAAGDYREVVRYVGWSCEAELSFEMVEKVTCPDGIVAQPSGYLVKDALDHIRGHAGSPDVGEPVVLEVRTWRLVGGLEIVDCPVTRCRAVLE